MIRIINKEQVQSALSMQQAIEVTEQVFRKIHEDKAVVPLRIGIDVLTCGDSNSNCEKKCGTTFFMPSHIRSVGLGLKIVSVRPDNGKNNLPTVPGVIMLADEVTGLPLALINATELTCIRTAAGSAVATKYLAREDSHVLLVFGAGNQAKAHIQAMCCVRPITHVYIHNRTTENAMKLAQEILASAAAAAAATTTTTTTTTIQHVAVAITHDDNVSTASANSNAITNNIATIALDEAIRQADIICTTTNSSTPVLEGAKISKGTHINCIGAYTPRMQEVDAETVRRAKVVADIKEMCLEEAGDLLIPIQQGIVTKDHILADLGELVVMASESASRLANGNGGCVGRVRTSVEDITLFKSVGVAAQDIGLAALIYENATKLNIGTVVDLGF